MRKFSEQIPLLITVAALISISAWLAAPPKQVEFERSPASTTLKFSQKTFLRSPFSSDPLALGDLPGLVAPIGLAKAIVDSADSIISHNTDLTVKIDNTCLQRAQQAGLKLPHQTELIFLRPPSDLAIQYYAFRLRQDKTVAEVRGLFEQDPCILGIAGDGEVEAGALYADPENAQQLHLAAIRAEQSEDLFFNSSLDGATAVLGVVDTGVDYNHEDLKDQMWSDSQDHHGFDFVNDDNDPMDDYGHGTHVAGLAAASGGNLKNGSGVAPKNVQIMAVKVLRNDGKGAYSDIATGVRWAIDHGAHVINLSASGTGSNAAVKDALIYAVNNGVPVFVSAGNDNYELNATNVRTPSSFGSQIPGVVTVGSIDSVTHQRSSFSNFSTSKVELGAPGSNGTFSTTPNNGFAVMQGTSMSTPVAAGAAALAIAALLARDIPYSAAQIEELVTLSALNNPELESFFTAGRELDLPRLAQRLLHEFVLTSDGGLESAP